MSQLSSIIAATQTQIELAKINEFEKNRNTAYRQIVKMMYVMMGSTGWDSDDIIYALMCIKEFANENSDYETASEVAEQCIELEMSPDKAE